MKIIKNNIIPFKGFSAINLFGVIFARRDLTLYEINHEKIHTEQMKELLYILFYILYYIEWLYKLFIFKDSKIAYRNISFEKEAYSNERNLKYKRKHFAQWKNKNRQLN